MKEIEIKQKWSLDKDVLHIHVNSLFLQVTINDLQVGEIKVSAVYSVRNLGAWFDFFYFYLTVFIDFQVL